jgi:DNA mismatch repair protein MutS
MAVSEWKGEVRFLRELKKGGTNRSYGVHVAGMAGLPSETIARARQILKLLEKKDLDFRSQTQSDLEQPSLFENKNEQVLIELQSLELDKMTPLEAMTWLAEKKKEIT